MKPYRYKLIMDAFTLPQGYFVFFLSCSGVLSVLFIVPTSHLYVPPS